MQKKMILWVLGEENPNTDTTYKAIKIPLDKLEIDYISYLSHFRARRLSTKEYIIEGFLSDSFVEIRYLIVSGVTSFPDYVFYLQEKRPDNDSTPIHAIEATKNGFEAAGNMTDQRSEKDVLFREKFGTNVPFTYFLNTPFNSSNVPKTSNLRALRRMATCEVQICHSFIGTENYSKIDISPFSSIDELVEDDRNLAWLGNGNIAFSLPLWKSGNPSDFSDPNVGRLCSIANTLRKLGFEGKFSIKNPKISTKKFKSRNKMSLILNALLDFFAEIDVEGIGKLEKQEFSDEGYIEFDIEGEKIASLALENIFLEKGYKIIFSNHAGCEKGFICTEDGRWVSLPGKDKYGEKYGIPDLVVVDIKNKKILFFEAEQYKKKNKGHDQILAPKFVRGCQFIMSFYPGYSAEIHLATYGEKCASEIFYSLDKDNNEVLKFDAEPVIRLESLI